MNASATPNHKMKATIREEIVLPQGVSARIESQFLMFKGPKGEAQKKLYAPKVKLSVENGKILFLAEKATKREKKLVMSFVSHAKNLVMGVTEGFRYRMKICSGHFPITATAKEGEFTVKNFLGERAPRVMKLRSDVKISVEGSEIAIESTNIESAGQTAADIEQLCRIRNRDLRIYQDGIWIIEKAGEPIV